jgi:hypothetical protein
VSMNADETPEKLSPSTSTEPSSEMTLEEWMDAFGAAAIEGFPKVVERDRREREAYYARVERRMALAKLAQKLGLPAPDPWDE